VTQQSSIANPVTQQLTTANPVAQQKTTANPVAQQIAASMNQSNFNQAYLPYILANMTLEEKMNASWKVNDLYTWAAYEDTELDLKYVSNFTLNPL
jgi:hypothetical protein